jgi:hypothetical protein
MPCKSTANYQDIFDDTLSGIMNVVNDTVFKFIICGGDFNIDFNVGTEVFLVRYLRSFMNGLSVVAADTLLSFPGVKSYRHASQNASSLIDHSWSLLTYLITSLMLTSWMKVIICQIIFH